MTATYFGWLQIARLGLIQACLGAVVVVTTSTLNCIMVVELAMPALLPGFLVAWHYAVQIVRPLHLYNFLKRNSIFAFG